MDSKGEIIYFNNCIIIMTTNIGFSNNIGFNNQKMNELKEYFGYDDTATEPLILE